MDGSSPAETPLVNRLTIAHLFLWITTTAVLLGCVLATNSVWSERQRLSSGMSDVEGGYKDPPLVRSYRIAALVGTPIYGAAMAGAVLGLWRMATRRFLFPTQPGHWLLILIAVFSLQSLVPLGLLAQSESTGGVIAFVQRIGCAALSAALAATAAMQVPFLRWRILFWLCAAGFGAQLLELLDLAAAPLGSMLGGMLAFALLSFAVPVSLVCSGIDLTMASHFDVFHWIGVVALFAAIANITITPSVAMSALLR